MKQNVTLKILGISTLIIGCLWIAWQILSFIKVEEIPFLIISNQIVLNLIILILFVFAFLSYVILYEKQMKSFRKEQSLNNEIERKCKWEKFQYDLYKEERIEKSRYDRMEKLIDKMGNKEVPDNYVLKKEFEEFKSNMETWKIKKEKQLFIEIKKYNNDKTE